MEQHEEWMEEKAYLIENEMEKSAFVREFTEKDLPYQHISEELLQANKKMSQKMSQKNRNEKFLNY